jgi:hypothetical protein
MFVIYLSTTHTWIEFDGLSTKHMNISKPSQPFCLLVEENDLLLKCGKCEVVAFLCPWIHDIIVCPRNESLNPNYLILFLYYPSIWI